MKKIRLGNDIHVSWEILRNGEPEDFTDKVVEVKLVHAQTFTAVPIEWTIEGNVIEFDFFGKDQKRKGEYRIILTENRGELGMSTLDACEAFYLVDHSCKESEGTKCPTLKVQHVRLTGSFSLSGGGGKGSEGFVLVTYNGDITDDDYNKLYESIKSGNSVLIKFVEVSGTEGYASILSSELRSNGDIFFTFNDTAAVQAALISGESVEGYHALTIKEFESGGSFPNVDELPPIGNLTGEEKVILTLQGENYQTNMNTVKEWALKNNQFISYPTMNDYDANKANLTEECYVAIDETEEVFLHRLKPAWNAYYELEEAYVNTVQGQVGSMLDGAPLTLRADLFKSFVVNGEERITGNEVFNPQDITSAAITVPFNVGDVYEVYFELKDLSDYTIISGEEELAYMFLYSPLTKITLDKSFASANDSLAGTPYILAIYSIQGCPSMREITFNFEADPWKGNLNAVDGIMNAFRKQGGFTGLFGMLTTGERIARIPNGDWGEEYSESMDLSKEGLITAFTVPNQDYNYTIERYDYGTI